MSAMTQSAADAFLVDAQVYRAELIAHCYRMVGSCTRPRTSSRTYLRAWRPGRLRRRSSERTWLYRIATNLCLTALAHGRRRCCPRTDAGPDRARRRSSRPGDPKLWLEPFPDQVVSDPADVVAARASVRLALVASLQYLPARQRAVFLLREVPSYPPADVAELLT